jgi:hypothetical protein
MGKHKSPFTAWIFEDWDQLVLSNGAKLPRDERRRRWRALYEKTTRDGAWIVPLDDANLVGSLGWALAMEDKDFMRARELARSLLHHPEMKPELLWTAGISSLVADEAVADILCGNVSEGCLKLRNHLRHVRQEPRIKHEVRNCAVGLMEAEMEVLSEADPAIRELVVEVLNAYPNKKRAAKRAAAAGTYGELVQVMYDAFGW